MTDAVVEGVELSSIAVPMVLTPRQRMLIALAVGVVAGAYAYAYRRGEPVTADFDAIWLAGRALVLRIDPYRYVGAHFPFPFYYPLTAGVIGLPFALLPRDAASILFSGVGLGVLAYALLEHGYARLLWLANYPVIEATVHSQWTPLLTSIAFMPALAWITLGKPTSGLAVALAYVERTASDRALRINIVAAGLVTAAAFLWLPTWVSEWWNNASSAHQYVALVRRPGGIVLLLALVRWRRPEARLLVLLAVVPQTAAQYEALPLILALTTTREAMAFGVLTLGASVIAQPAFTADPTAFAAIMAHNAQVHLFLIYVPVLLMILRRPNEGTMLGRRRGRIPV